MTFYVSVDDLAASVSKAEELGAKVIQLVTALEGGPTIAMIADPEGHHIGMMQQPA